MLTLQSVLPLPWQISTNVSKVTAQDINIVWPPLQYVRSKHKPPHLEPSGHFCLYLASNIHDCSRPTQDLALNVNFRIYFVTSANESARILFWQERKAENVTYFVNNSSRGWIEGCVTTAVLSKYERKNTGHLKVHFNLWVNTKALYQHMSRLFF